MTTERTSFERTLRRFEWLAVGLALFVFSGAVFPLLMAGADGALDPADRSRLRVVNLPAYAIILGLVAYRPLLPLRAMMRNLPMLVLVLLTFISTFWSISQSITLRRAIALLLSMALACLLATRFTPRQQILLLGCVLGSASMLSLLAGAVLPGLAYLPGDSALRGVFINKNVLGWFASFTVLLGLAAQQDLSRAMRRGGWALIVVGGLATLLSGSATSLISAVASCLVILGLRFLVQRRGMARLVARLLLLMATILLLAALFIGLLPLLEVLGKDTTLTGRVPLWELVTGEIARHPLLGYGYGVFWSEANPVAWRIWAAITWQAPHAHQGYLDLLLGVGAIGLCVFVLVTLRALKQGTALCTAAPHDGWFWCVAAIGTALAMNLSESTFLMQNDLMWVLFASAALTISMRHAELVQSPPRQTILASAAV